MSEERHTLETAASAAGLTLPDRLRDAFEGTSGSTRPRRRRRPGDGVEAIVRARAAEPSDAPIGEQLINTIGLLA